MKRAHRNARSFASVLGETNDLSAKMSALDAGPLSLFQKVLLTTDGTVTGLIELYAGETIRVRKIDQKIIRDVAPVELGVPMGTPLLQRRILLSGKTENYLFAESLFVFDQLSTSTQRRLLESDEPIGLIWRDERIETYREIIEHRLEICRTVAAYFALSANTPILSRTYLIFHRAKPFGIITEKFPITSFRER